MNIKKLTTETRNAHSMNIDSVSTLEMVKIINNEDKKIADAIELVLEDIAGAIDAMAPKFIAGGRIIYMGAGTSGRLGVLDAIELTPTYSVDPTEAFGLIAGGKEAMYVAVEGAEDSAELAIQDLKDNHFNENDILISIAASGRTPYAIGAIEYANEIGALSISVTCNGDSAMSKIAQHSIAPVVGPEVVTGSTRMKAGSAQKMVLNMLSTGTMIRSGKVYSNLMINVQPTNEKLQRRSEHIVADATGLELNDAIELFEEANRNIPAAIVMHETEATYNAAMTTLKDNNNNVYQSIQALKGE